MSLADWSPAFALASVTCCCHSISMAEPAAAVVAGLVLCTQPVTLIISVNLTQFVLDLCITNSALCHLSQSRGSLSWESWSIRSPDTRKIASSNLAESILAVLAITAFFFFCRRQHCPPPDQTSRLTTGAAAAVVAGQLCTNQVT
jgi:hypothetical protein